MKKSLAEEEAVLLRSSDKSPDGNKWAVARCQSQSHSERQKHRRGLKQAVTAWGADVIHTGEQGTSPAEAGTLLWLLQCPLQLGKHRERGTCGSDMWPRRDRANKRQELPPEHLRSLPTLSLEDKADKQDWN